MTNEINPTGLDWNPLQSTVPIEMEIDLEFSPIHDAFSAKDFQILCDISEEEYRAGVERKEILFSASFENSFNTFLRAHNFYDLVQFTYWQAVRKQLGSSLDSMEVSRLYCDILAELLDLDDLLDTQDWAHFTTSEITATINEYPGLFDNIETSLSRLPNTIDQAMYDTILLFRRVNRFANGQLGATALPVIYDQRSFEAAL